MCTRTHVFVYILRQGNKREETHTIISSCPEFVMTCAYNRLKHISIVDSTSYSRTKMRSSSNSKGRDPVGQDVEVAV